MKKLLKWGIPLILLLIVLFLIRFDTTIYLAFEADPGPAYADNVTVKVDDTIIFDNVTLYPEWSGINVKVEKISMRMGLHKIEASTNNGDIFLKQRVFILFSHYIMIVYWDMDKFTVRTGFKPYLFM